MFSLTGCVHGLRPNSLKISALQRLLASNYAVSRAEDHLIIHAKDEEHKFTFQWLRDHCRNPLCYDSGTHQRSVNLLDFSPDIHPVEFALDDQSEDKLDITWNDQHTSSFQIDWLMEQSARSHRGNAFRRIVRPSSWNSRTFPSDGQTTTPFKDYMNPDQGGVERMAHSIMEHGYAMVSEVEPTVEATKLTVERFTPVAQTVYGEMFLLENREAEDHSDSSYSNIALGAHTDTTYYNEAFGLQIFHCLQPALQGGENILVDGFDIARQLKAADPQAYEFLSANSLEAEYIHTKSEPNEHYYNVDLVFKHHPLSGELEQFRFNVYDRAPHKMTLDQQRLFYQHYRTLAALVRDQCNEQRILLCPGTVLFIDNWRVMHGRTAFKGPRTMTGCYVNRSDFKSRVKVMGLD
eukprot:maker-scaffold170_size291898-snap-gene-1.47 protein:Tk03015 transcript:maker-scaffold170_size291898-snap-gene-1.47-mRNA-1 annotation:"trimethyllysine mitochondrial"